MDKISKLKTDDWGYILFTLLIIVVLICTWIFFGKEAFYYALCVMPFMAALVLFVSYLKTRNWGHLIPMFFYVFIVLTFFPPLSQGSKTKILFGSTAMILFIGEIIILKSKRIAWRYREILELAAKPIDESADGFTPRPFPAGTAQYSKEEILGFTKFMIKHVIAYPFVEKDRIVLVIPENMFAYMLLLKRGYKKDTYVTFDFDGNVTVSIAKKDYQKYKEEFTFDQLCSSLGNLFIEFLELYQKNQSHEIINRLNRI